MKEYETLTREKVDVVPFGCGMPETHLMQDWSDRMLDCAITSRSLRRTTGSSPPAPSVALSAGRQTRPAGSLHWSPTSEPPAQPAR